MSKLIYVANVSLDGYIEDAHGRFEWTDPADEVFTFITDLVRPVGTYLYGRRMYETMAVWETQPALAAQSELMADFANVWQAADKIVYSTTLHAVSTANTQLERRFDPGSVRDMKTSAASDLTVGGPTLAAHAFAAGLVDECQLFIYPVAACYEPSANDIPCSASAALSRRTALGPTPCSASRSSDRWCVRSARRVMPRAASARVAGAPICGKGPSFVIVVPSRRDNTVAATTLHTRGTHRAPSPIRLTASRP
jgi:dihydrofolate reductase